MHSLVLINAQTLVILCAAACELPSHISQEVELLEACLYGLVREVPYLLWTGANANIATFVSAHS